MFVTGYLKESNQWSVVDTRNLMKKKNLSPMIVLHSTSILDNPDLDFFFPVHSLDCPVPHLSKCFLSF